MDEHIGESGKVSIRYLRAYYRSGDDDLQRDFFRPCISRCSRYRRGVGFFTSAALAGWADALRNVMELPPGSIQLLASPILEEADKEALRAAVGPERERILQQAADELLLDACDEEKASPDGAGRVLAWLVAKGVLQIRFAFASHQDSAGIYHEKIGIFDFPDGSSVAFTGSANETRGGYTRNYETLDVFRSWIPDDEARVQTKLDQFNYAWEKRAPGLEILELSEEALARVRTYVAGFEEPSVDGPAGKTPEEARWRHQDKAIETFMSARRGVLEMATGTGKTRTAVRIIENLIDEEQVNSVVVAADGNDLLDQWFAELVPLAMRLERRFTVLRHYGAHHDTDRYVHHPEGKMILVSRTNLPGVLRPLVHPENVLLVHDEVHKLGSPANRTNLAGLSSRIIWRLGLSATPEREYDTEGTEFIREHVGDVIYEFGLAEAIERRVLCGFEYIPLYYEPDEADREGIARVYRMRAARNTAGHPMTDAEFWIELARVHKTSQAKLPIFAQFVAHNPEVLTRCIVFVETKEYGEQVLPLIHATHAEFHTYFDGDEKDVLDRFAAGQLQCLVTCHRLSEGIDIRDLRNVVLFSSARARLETIQRMGRCLRWDPEDPNKRAHVVDFIRLGHDDEQNTDTVRAEWLAMLSSASPEA